MVVERKRVGQKERTFGSISFGVLQVYQAKELLRFEEKALFFLFFYFFYFLFFLLEDLCCVRVISNTQTMNPATARVLIRCGRIGYKRRSISLTLGAKMREGFQLLPGHLGAISGHFYYY